MGLPSMKVTHALESVSGHLEFDERGIAKEAEVLYPVNNVTMLNELRGVTTKQDQLTGHLITHRRSVDVVPGNEPWD